MRRCVVFITLLVAVCGPRTVSAQSKAYSVAVLAPLYLDSTFDAGGNYRLGKQYPRYAFPGLEFAEGARLAMDTLQIQGAVIHYTLFDIRSADQTIQHLMDTHRLDSVQLIIASVSGPEFQMLADFAKSRNIPFVSATWPNDGGITANPFVCILNPTILAHCEAIYHFVLQNHPTHQFLYVRRAGAMEDRIEGYFKQLNVARGTPLLSMQTVMAGDSMNAATLQPYLDSNRYAVIVCGSLDEAFGVSLVRACSTLSTTYPMTLIGMPTWQGSRALESPDLRNTPYLYTTSFLLPDMDSATTVLSLPQRFASLTRTKPGDMAFEGYESTYFFANLLLHYPGVLMSHVGETGFQTYTPYDIKPVFLKEGSQVPDFFENKHIYILRRQNGAVVRIQ